MGYTRWISTKHARHSPIRLLASVLMLPLRTSFLLRNGTPQLTISRCPLAASALVVVLLNGSFGYEDIQQRNISLLTQALFFPLLCDRYEGFSGLKSQRVEESASCIYTITCGLQVYKELNQKKKETQALV